MIPLSPTFPPVRVITKPATADPSDGEGQPASVQEAASLSLSEATDLLDWLENHEIRPSNVEMDSAGRVTVRWAV
jgi:hypothetical protein